MNVSRLISRNRFALILVALNLCLFVYGAFGLWRESGRNIGPGCFTTAQRNDDPGPPECNFLAPPGMVIGGLWYILPDYLNLVTVLPLVHRSPPMCVCTELRFEMGGILIFSSLQAALVGFGLDRLVNHKRTS